jgi:putative membrane protein
MKPLESFRITPVAAAVFVASALLASGCSKHDADDTTTPAAGDTATPAADASTSTPADTAAANGTMAGDTGATADTTGTGATTGTDAMGTSANPGDMGSTAPATTGPVTDTDFYTEAMKGDQKEIAVSQMVAKKSTNADVKALANKIASDHQALDKKVKAAAGSKVTPPPADTTMTSALEGKTGTDLDRAYVDMMVTDHQTDIPKFENASQNASTDEAKKLATDALPKLRDHLKSAQDVQQKLSGT